MTRHRVPVLVYHRVYEGADRALEQMRIHLTVDRFRAQIGWLKRHGYQAVSLDEAVRAAEGSPVPGKRVAITFDDGFEDTFTHALPVLRAAGFTATVFLVANHIGGVNQWDVDAGLPPARLLDATMIRAMQREGIAFGSHGAAHRKLTLLDEAVRAEEIRGSRERLEDFLGTAVQHFSYPYLAANPSIEAEVQAAGYRSACGGDRGDYRPFLLSRIDITQDGPMTAAWKMSDMRFRLRANTLLRRARAHLRHRGPAVRAAASQTWSELP